MKKQKRKLSDNPEDGWQSKYMILQHDDEVCAVYSNRWHSVSPRKRISPLFDFRFEAEEWIKTKWKAHIDKKFENIILNPDTKNP